MNRFEKKCFVGSATFHGVLLAVIFLGAAFSSNKLPPDMGPPVEVNLGGAPAPKGAAPANPPQPTPPPPQQEKVEPPPQPEAVKQPDPEPPKPKVPRRDEPKETETKAGDLPVPVKKEAKNKDVKETAKPQSPPVNTKVVRRSNVVDQAAIKLAQNRRDQQLRAERAAQAAAQAAAAAERNAAISAVNRIVGSMGDGSSNTRVVSSTPIGNGTGAGSGAASGRYGDQLQALYDSKWILNADAYDEETAASVRVVVRRDGTIVSSTITKSSGNAAFDRSVRNALSGVSRALPFPADMKNAEQVFTWRFERKTRAG